MDLNKEAEEKYPFVAKTQFIYTENDRLFFMKKAHINALTNSKYFQAKIIQAQIEENESILKMLKLHGNARNRLPVIERISNLQVQLKELEDER